MWRVRVTVQTAEHTEGTWAYDVDAHTDIYAAEIAEDRALTDGAARILETRCEAVHA